MASASIVGRRQEKSGVVYEVEVRGLGATYSLEKTFEDFWALHAAVGPQFGAALPAPGTKSRFFRKLLASFQKDRERQLGRYLEALLHVDPELRDDDIRLFLANAESCSTVASEAESPMHRVPLMPFPAEAAASAEPEPDQAAEAADEQADEDGVAEKAAEEAEEAAAAAKVAAEQAAAEKAAAEKVAAETAAAEAEAVEAAEKAAAEKAAAEAAEKAAAEKAAAEAAEKAVAEKAAAEAAEKAAAEATEKAAAEKAAAEAAEKAAAEAAEKAAVEAALAEQAAAAAAEQGARLQAAATVARCASRASARAATQAAAAPKAAVPSADELFHATDSEHALVETESDVEHTPLGAAPASAPAESTASLLERIKPFGFGQAELRSRAVIQAD